MSDSPLRIPQSAGEGAVASLERLGIRILGYLPGMRGVGSSGRLVVAFRGSLWTIIGYAAGQVLRLVSTIVLARQLLGPQAFGLIALVNVFLSGLDMLSDLGIGMDVIQHRRGDDPRFINTAFTIQASRGLLLWIIATALAYPFASFYNQPGVRWLAIVGALSVGVRGVASSSVWLMTRHLQIRKLTLLSVSSEVAGLVVSVTWACISPTAWALVAGRGAASVAYTIGSHLVADNRSRLEWERNAVRDILIFGTGIFLSTATYFLGGEAERLVIAKFISVAELGCFSLALTISAAPSRAIQQVVGQVFFPLISNSIRKDPATAARHYKSARWAFLFLGIVLGVAFVAYSHRLVAILLPPKYGMTSWMLQLLGFRAAQEVFAAPISSLILAFGNSRYAALANTARLVLMVGGVWWAFARFGIHQGIAVLAFVPVLTYFVLIPGIAKHLRQALAAELVGVIIFLLAMTLAAILPWPWA